MLEIFIYNCAGITERQYRGLTPTHVTWTITLPRKPYVHIHFHSCSMHFDVIKSFICPTNAQLNCFKMLKLTVRFVINAPTCFGLKKKPLSGSLQSVLCSSYNIGIRKNTSLLNWSVLWPHINLLKPTCYMMHQQFNIQQLYALPTLYLCVLCLSENKQWLVPLTA